MLSANGIFYFPSETVERNSTKLNRKQDLNVCYQVCVFRADRKNKMAARPLICWYIFDFLHCWGEFNESWQEARSQRPVPRLCFRADRKNKMAALVSDLLRHFPLLLWIGWIEFHETWQELRSQRLLSSLCFSGWSKKAMAAPASDWLRHFQFFLWNQWMEFNEIWQKARSKWMSSTKIVFFSGGRISKQKLSFLQTCQKGGTWYKK